MADEVSSLRALAHPVRLRMLSLLTGAELSAAEVARELGLTHANASYHLRVLAEAGEVVEAGRERIRGGEAKRYRHHWDHPRPPSTDRRGHEQQVRAMAEELVRRFRHRRPRSRTHLADAEVWVEPEPWRRAMALVAEAAALVHSEARPPRTPGTVHVNLTSVMFELDA